MIDQCCTTDVTEKPVASVSSHRISPHARPLKCDKPPIREPCALASEITAAPYDVTQSYGADWTVELFRKPAQVLSDRIPAMMKELQPASPAAHFRPLAYRSEERRNAERSSLDVGARTRHFHSVLCPQDAVETFYISQLSRPEGDNPCL